MAETHYAIFTDYSGVVPTRGGKFTSRAQALEALIQHLESQKATVQFCLSRARQDLRRERRKT